MKTVLAPAAASFKSRWNGGAFREDAPGRNTRFSSSGLPAILADFGLGSISGPGSRLPADDKNAVPQLASSDDTGDVRVR